MRINTAGLRGLSREEIGRAFDKAVYAGGHDLVTYEDTVLRRALGRARKRVMWLWEQENGA